MLTRRGRRVALEAVAMLASTALVAALPSSLQATGPWSEPAVLAPCSAPGAPAVLFPADEPRHGTGPGAIVWGAAVGCSGAGGARVSAIAPGADVPGPSYEPRGPRGRPLGLAAPIAAESAPHGRILLAGASGSRGTSRGRGGDRGNGADGLRLSEGAADGGPFTTPSATGGSAGPPALTSAYLGDVALVSPGGSGGSRLELRIHRYYTGSFSPPVAVTGAHGVQAVAVAMDYRSDALVAWERAETIVARYMPQSERSGRPAERVASAYPGAHIAAILSDDDRAILAWSETHDGVTSVYAELSGTGVRWGTPRLLERFTDPGGAPADGGGAPRLVRLASESVMLAWSGVSAGHWVVHTAAVDENGVRTIDTISAPGRDAVLDDLAPGPGDEAYALWSEPGADATSATGTASATGAGAEAAVDRGDREQALYGARGIDAYPGRTIFTAPERIVVAGAGGVSGDEATVGVDPDTDRAIAAWRTSGGAVEYSLRGLGGG